MKKLLLLIVIGMILYWVFLAAPVGVFFWQFSSLEFSDEILQEQLNALSTLAVIEPSSDEDNANSRQMLTVSVTEENAETMLYNALLKQQNGVITVNQVHMEISPEMIRLDLTFQLGLKDFLSFETTVFSEWMVEAFPREAEKDGTKTIGIKPVDIHTSHLYTFNWGELWEPLTKTRVSDGWFLLPLDSQLRIHELSLQDQELSVSLFF
jgi:hypothetical protein